MSVVAAKFTKDNEITMAADSLSRSGTVKRLNSKKIYSFESWGFIMGSVGQTRDKYLFEDFIKDRSGAGISINPIKTRKDVLTLITEYRRWKDERKLDPQDSDTDFIIGCQDGLFVCTGFGEITTYNEFVAIGSGKQAATALMYGGYGPKEAVDICRKMVYGVGGQTRVVKIGFGG